MKLLFELKYQDAKKLLDDLIKLTYADTLHERFELLDKIREIIFNSDIKYEGGVKK